MKNSIEDFFKLKELNTDIKTEIMAGLTTFLAMAYIIFVNPGMISKTGMDFGSAMMATCISAGIATMMMGIYVNYPIALAAGMGENAFFTFVVCITMKIPWQVALACVFIEGIIFLILSLTKIRQALLESIPLSLRSGIACGIGVFISFLGLHDAGIIVGNPATMVGLGDILSAPCVLAMTGLFITGVLLIRNIHGAILLGILITALVGIPLGILKYNGIVSVPPSIAPTFMKMDFAGAFNLGLLSIIFIFLFMDIFDTVGTLAGVGELGGYIKDGKFPRVGKAFITDSIGTCVGAVCGTPTVTSYIESSAGIACGGRSGLTSVVTGLLFLLAMFFSPLIKMIGGGYEMPNGQILNPVTAPALIIVGSMMFQSITKINWKDYSEGIPAFLVIVLIPLTFSIATGIAMAFIAFAVLKLFSGRWRECSLLIYICAAIFIFRFAFLK